MILLLHAPVWYGGSITARLRGFSHVIHGFLSGLPEVVTVTYDCV